MRFFRRRSPIDNCIKQIRAARTEEGKLQIAIEFIGVTQGLTFYDLLNIVNVSNNKAGVVIGFLARRNQMRSADLVTILDQLPEDSKSEVVLEFVNKDNPMSSEHLVAILSRLPEAQRAGVACASLSRGNRMESADLVAIPDLFPDGDRFVVVDEFIGRDNPMLSEHLVAILSRLPADQRVRVACASLARRNRMESADLVAILDLLSDGEKSEVVREFVVRGNRILATDLDLVLRQLPEAERDDIVFINPPELPILEVAIEQQNIGDAGLEFAGFGEHLFYTQHGIMASIHYSIYSSALGGEYTTGKDLVDCIHRSATYPQINQNYIEEYKIGFVDDRMGGEDKKRYDDLNQQFKKLLGQETANIDDIKKFFSDAGMDAGAIAMQHPNVSNVANEQDRQNALEVTKEDNWKKIQQNFNNFKPIFAELFKLPDGLNNFIMATVGLNDGCHVNIGTQLHLIAYRQFCKDDCEAIFFDVVHEAIIRPILQSGNDAIGGQSNPLSLSVVQNCYVSNQMFFDEVAKYCAKSNDNSWGLIAKELGEEKRDQIVDRICKKDQDGDHIFDESSQRRAAEVATYLVIAKTCKIPALLNLGVVSPDLLEIVNSNPETSPQNPQIETKEEFREHG